MNEEAVAEALDIPADNIYHGTQDHYDGCDAGHAGRFHALAEARQLPDHGNQRADRPTGRRRSSIRPTTGSCARTCIPTLSNGANMVEYWHWASIAGGQETYWKGILSHDLEPNRAYAEMSRTAHELEKIGPHLVGLKIKNQVAILWSRDSANAIGFMPFTSNAAMPWEPGRATAGYDSLVQQIHRALYDLNVGADFVFPGDAGFLGIQAADRAGALYL